MHEMIAFCGLLCNECGAFIATRDDDDEKRAEVAETWSKQFNADIKPQDVNCDGCLSPVTGNADYEELQKRALV